MKKNLKQNRLLVWDLPVRLFHWLLVIALVAAWYTSDGEKGLIEYHLQIGYFILGLILFRLVWGVIGTYHAKFSSFFPTKSRFIAYSKLTKKDKSQTTIGHNPVGALMVFAMLLLFLAQAVSGLFMKDDVFTTGPYFDSVSSSVQKLMSQVHHNVFDIIVVFAVLHIAAIFYYFFGKKINLISAMITGYKYRKEEQDNKVKSSKLPLALFVILIVVIFLYWLLVLNIPVEEEFYF
ncbi:MAG: cytochrome b/b6 domain-containing protein [Colwellia sp.]